MSELWSSSWPAIGLGLFVGFVLGWVARNRYQFRLEVRGLVESAEDLVHAEHERERRTIGWALERLELGRKPNPEAAEELARRYGRLRN